MKYLSIVLALSILCGCTDREKPAKAPGPKPTINVAGKQAPAPPLGISEPYTLVDGKWVPSRLVRTRCEHGQCKVYVIEETRVPARNH